MGSSIDLGHAWRSAVFLSVVTVAIPAAALAQQPQQTTAASAQAPAPSVQAAPAPRPPTLNRANELLPPWLRVRGEFR